MLGIGKRAVGWSWFATGKQRCAKDYFCVGDPFPLARSLSAWVEHGYLRGATRSDFAREATSCRFWISGGGRDSLAFGVIMASSDYFGRPFPLLVMGEGTVKDWQRGWEWLPAYLHPSWKAMEAIATEDHENVAAFSLKLSTQALAPQGQIGEPDAAVAGIPPTAVFICDGTDRERITFFNRALSSPDFQGIWWSESGAENGAT